MHKELFEHPDYHEGIEADAVCAQCGSANPEGTLICKTCGNNLRDQRLMRIAADQILDADVEGTVKVSFLAKAVALLGLLVVLWLGLNVDKIYTSLTKPRPLYDDASQGADAILFWEGDSRQMYDEYQGRLQKRFPSFSDAEAARLESEAMTSFNEGLYALYERHGSTEQFIGAGLAWMYNGEWHYVAQINTGIQVRGKATVTEQILHSQWGDAGMQDNGSFHALTGQASLGVDGVITISGRSDSALGKYQSAAYRLGSL
ncbi:MAG TPA: zinc ribbon domain-containing protein [Candidatus Hydrogenedentes bacterium]|jgi:hypothetical protein|nr:zinc ribbon domain-containing protein [Candidatus Hydrogenedentota bacterium]HQN00862.1 zinc ribbon domain-containing protein [Candidatus Hydrogenedentota bacterium]